MIEVRSPALLVCKYSTGEEYLMYNRRSIRLKGYNYSSDGYYFITICTHQKQQIFGTIKNGIMHLNEYGKIAYNEWIKSDQIRHELKLDEFIIMPDHMHGFVIINTRSRGAGPCAPTDTTCTPTDTTCAPTDTTCTPTDTTCTPTNTPYNPTGNSLYNPTGKPSYNPAIITPYNNNENTGIAKRLPKSISSFISGYKSSVTTQINRMRNTRGEKIWQRNYYDNIIHSENDYYRIVEYIRQNPQRSIKKKYRVSGKE